MNPARLLVFEGPDGAGKTTLAHRLVDHLRRRNVDCSYHAFPGREARTLGAHVYALHHDPARFEVDRISPDALQMLHVAAHVDALQSRIIPKLQAGQTVVLDRFWWSTEAYGLRDGMTAVALKRLLAVEHHYWQSFVPSVVFLISRQSPESTTPDGAGRLKSIYSAIARRERRKYPVRAIENHDSIAAAFNQVVHALPPALAGGRPPAQLSLFKADNPPSIAVESENDQVSAPAAELPNGRITIAVPKPFPATTPVYRTYWLFAAKRQEIFFERLAGQPPPWTDDPILLRHKFTNAYRASDRVSQYLIRNVIYRPDLSESAEEVFFRTLLFKTFNRIDTWELLERELGAVRYADYSFARYDEILSRAMNAGTRIYSAAYMMPSVTAFGHAKKHQNHLLLLEKMIADRLPEQIAGSARMEDGFTSIRAYPGIGDFLAYQYITDLNYSPFLPFQEDEFVVPGPGARDGIRKCFHELDMDESELIARVTDRQEAEFAELEIDFRSLWGRRLQYIDCQNLFCEVDKYARVAHPEVMGLSGRSRIKQIYALTPKSIAYWYPPKWGLNHLIPAPVPFPEFLELPAAPTAQAEFAFGG